jgi:hypothetical protein
MIIAEAANFMNQQDLSSWDRLRITLVSQGNQCLVGTWTSLPTEGPGVKERTPGLQ